MNLKNLAISETGFVFDPMSGATFTVNATGKKVLEALREGLGDGAIVEQLIEHFDAVSLTVRDDIADFVASLRSHGLVPADFHVGNSRGVR